MISESQKMLEITGTVYTLNPMITADLSDIRKLERFFKRAPSQLPRSTASVLTGMAFEARKIDIEILSRYLIVRNRKFMESSIRVQKARSGRIETQAAFVGSINRPNFTGWAEQETGAIPKVQRAATLRARGGSKRGQIQSKARLRKANKFYKPEQFQGRTLQQRFGFMMRVLNTMGGSQYFIASQDIPIRRGHISPGLYLIRQHRLMRLQGFQATKQTPRLDWNERMIQQVHHRNLAAKIWRRELDYLIKSGKF